MRGLLDTHILFWSLVDDTKMPASVRAPLGEGATNSSSVP